MYHPAVDFVLDFLKSKVPQSRALDAVRELMPLLTNLMTSDTILTDDRRASLQKTILNTLRRMGIEGQDIG